MKKNKTQKPVEKQAAPVELPISQKTGISFGQNLGMLLFAVFLLVIIYNNNEGYKWMYKQMLMGNLDIIKNNPDATEQDKIESKFGVDYTILKTIINNSPEDAVILFPTNKLIDSVRQLYKLPQRSERLSNRDWDEYFIFPRKIVQVGDKPNVAAKSTHVLLLAGVGYEQLGYDVPNEKKKFFEILPIKK
jgi:hypothetical protein